MSSTKIRLPCTTNTSFTLSSLGAVRATHMAMEHDGFTPLRELSPFARVRFIQCNNFYPLSIGIGYLKMQRTPVRRESRTIRQLWWTGEYLSSKYSCLGTGLSYFPIGNVAFHRSFESMATKLKLSHRELSTQCLQGLISGRQFKVSASTTVTFYRHPWLVEYWTDGRGFRRFLALANLVQPLAD